MQSSQATPSSNGAADTRKRRVAEIDSPAMPILPARKPHGKEESLEDFSDKTLSQIFRITLDPHKHEDAHGHRLLFLPDLHAELQQAGSTPRLSADMLDSAIQEAATAYPHDKPLLGYLLPCWKRVMRVIKTLRDKTPEKDAVLKEAKRLCMSNAIFALTIPALFGREPNPQVDSLTPYLLRDIDHDDGICLDFFNEAVSRLDEDDSILPLFVNAMRDISAKLAKMSMNDDYKPYINVSILSVPQAT
jgi:ubiquitin conjugation factor E4 B